MYCICYDFADLSPKPCVPQNTDFGFFWKNLHMTTSHLSWKFLIPHISPPAPSAPPARMASPLREGLFEANLTFFLFCSLFFARSAKRSKINVNPCFRSKNLWKHCIFNAFHGNFKISTHFQWKTTFFLQIPLKNMILSGFSWKFQHCHKIPMKMHVFTRHFSWKT